MFDILTIVGKTKLKKIDETFRAIDIKAGVLFNKSGEPCRKIMFIMNNGFAQDVFSDKIYSINDNESYNFFVNDIVSLGEPIMYFFQKVNLNLAEMYLVYKRFLSDNHFINRNLDYFDMCEREIGYKGKVEIVEKALLQSSKKQELYYKLLKIINYNIPDKKLEIENGTKRK